MKGDIVGCLAKGTNESGERKREGHGADSLSASTAHSCHYQNPGFVQMFTFLQAAMCLGGNSPSPTLGMGLIDLKVITFLLSVIDLEMGKSPNSDQSYVGDFWETFPCLKEQKEMLSLLSQGVVMSGEDTWKCRRHFSISLRMEPTTEDGGT